MAYITYTPVSRLFSLSGAVKAVMLWAEAAKERRALKSLGYSRLEDLGIDPKAADAEAARPFWSVAPRR